MRGKHNVKVFVLSPDGKMSAFQRAQMYSLQDANIFNIAVTGMFDDAGHREGCLQRCRVQGQVQDRCRQFDQMGALSRARSSYYFRAISWRPVKRRTGCLLRYTSGNFW